MNIGCDIMVILLTIYKYILRFVYFFLKLLPTKKKQILLLSRQTNEPSLDFQYILVEELDAIPSQIRRCCTVEFNLGR